MFFNFGGVPFMGGGAGPEMFFEDAPPTSHPNPDEDYYKTLGVDEKASEDELKKSYRKLSMLHHPDKNGNTDESKQKFQELNNAYETLSDGNKRRMYDMMRKGGGPGHGIPGGHPFEHVFHFGGGRDQESPKSYYTCYSDKDTAVDPADMADRARKSYSKHLIRVCEATTATHFNNPPDSKHNQSRLSKQSPYLSNNASMVVQSRSKSTDKSRTMILSESKKKRFMHKSRREFFKAIRLY
jgi:DnaJ-class molecular chaperone